MTESSLAVQLRPGTNGLDAFLFQARVPSVSPLSAVAAENDKRQSISLSFALSTLGHDMCTGMSWGTGLISKVTWDCRWTL